VDPAAALGVAVTRVTDLPWTLALLVIAITTVGATSASAERYAVIVTGASGSPEYAERFDIWRTAFVSLLRTGFDYGDDRLFELAERQAPGVREATAQQVRAVLGHVRQRVSEGDTVLILLMGHGTIFEGDDAKFNLVGPDLTLDEWASLVSPIPARVVFVNGTAGSFPFLRKLAGRDRVIVTATDTVAQRFVTIFPEFFVSAFHDGAADLNKDTRV
jgi:hypothetical protein